MPHDPNRFDPDDPFGTPPRPSAPGSYGGEPGPTVPLGRPSTRPPSPFSPSPGPGSPPPGGPGIPGLDFSDLPPLHDLYVPGKANAGASPPGGDRTVRLGGPPTGATPGAGYPAGADDGRTVGMLKPSVGVDPVVGWFVCVEGAEKGRDYRIRSGRNAIGRGPEMHIAIGGDPQISRDRHAVVVYDPRGNAFKIAPGDSAGLVYLNGVTVDVPTPLGAYDSVELGATRLVFVPLCSPHFRWDAPPA